MATIVIAVPAEMGHVNQSLPLARNLEGAGHRVVYFMDRPRLEKEQKTWRAFFDKNALELRFWCEAQLAHVSSAPSKIPIGFARKLSEFVSDRRYFDKKLALFVEGAAEAQLREVGAELVLADIIDSMPSLVAYGMGLRVGVFATNLIEADPSLLRAPPRTWMETDAWKRRFKRLKISPEPHAPVRRMAARVGYRGKLDQSRPFQTFLRGHLPMLALWPRVLKEVPDAEYSYGGAGVDRNRREPDADLSWIDPSRPFLYCALGSKVNQFGQAGDFFQRLFDAMRAHPDWQLLVGAGKHASSLENAPQNVRVIAEAPQLKVLARATAMITHCGFGSLKEALLFGVPLLGVPIRLDQPENARLLERIGVGLTADIRTATASELDALLVRLLGEPSFKQRAVALSKLFEAADGTELEWVRSLLDKKPIAAEARS